MSEFCWKSKEPQEGKSPDSDRGVHGDGWGVAKAGGRLMEHGAQETSGSKQAGQCQGQSLSVTGATVEPFFFFNVSPFFPS